MRTIQLERLQQRPLFAQMRRFIRLRWLAAGAVIVGSRIDSEWFHYYPHSPRMFTIGAVVVAYNCLFTLLLRRWVKWSNLSTHLVMMAWTQIVLDLACLTLLTLSTGGFSSPLLGFFVFHMVFASLMLPRPMAFGGAAVAMTMVGGTLFLTHSFPRGGDQRLAVIGWAMTLVLTVWVANVITLDLRNQRRRLIRKNSRIRAIKNELQRHQAVIVQQEKMAGLGQMAAGVAHEIANPLASMDSVLQLMLRKPEKLNTQSIATLREQVARIHRTVRQMTAFAHPLDNEWRDQALNDVVEEALRLARLDSRVRKAKIETQLDPDTGSITMLTHAMEQVLINLLLNALDATADVPEPKLVIKTGRREGWRFVEISDNGHGIPPELMSKIFEPFFTTKPVGKGTGLGLSISYSLMRKQGGSIEVKSALGNGTTFTLWLPERQEREIKPAVKPIEKLTPETAGNLIHWDAG